MKPKAMPTKIKTKVTIPGLGKTKVSPSSVVIKKGKGSFRDLVKGLRYVFPFSEHALG